MGKDKWIKGMNRTTVRLSFLTLFLLVSFIVTLIPLGVVGTTDVSNKTVETQAFNALWKSDVTLQGVYGTSANSFEISPYWNIQENAYTEIVYSSAGSAKAKASTITVYLNELPIETIYLPSNSVREVKVRVPLSKSLLKNGFNEVRVRSWHRLTDLPCEDDGNPGNWLIIHKSSLIHIPYKEKLSQTILADYPFPYVKSYSEKPIHFSYLVDQQSPSIDVKNAIMYNASDLGKQNRFKNLELKMTLVKDFNPRQQYIYFGTEIPQSLVKKTDRAVGIYEDKVTYYKMKSVEGGSILFVLSGNEKLLLNGAQGLSHDMLMKQLKSNYAEMSLQDLKLTEKPYTPERIAFKDLGYGNVIMEGIKVTSAAYFIDFPDQWLISKGARIILNIRYADHIDHKNSSITVMINNIPLGSVQLDKESSREKIISFEIPEELLSASSYNVTVKYFLEGDFDCTDVFNRQDYWNYTSNESLLELPHTIKAGFTLKDFPAPFIGNGGMENLNFVSSSNGTVAELEVLANIAAFIGHQATNSPEFTVTQDVLSVKKHNIVVGTWGNDLIRSKNNALNVPFMENGKRLKVEIINKSVPILDKEVATAQLIHSPESPYSDLWVIGSSKEGLKWINRFLSDLQLSDDLDGDTAIVDKHGFLQTAQVKEKLIEESADNSTLIKADSEAIAEVKRVSYENARNFVIFGGFIVLSIVGAVFYMSMRKKNHTL